MVHKFLHLLPLVFFINLLQAQQWYPATPFFYARDINTAHIFNRNSVFVAGGEDPAYRSIFTSGSYGVTWDFLYDGFAPWLKSAGFSDSLNGVAVGENSTLIKTVNGGASWSVVTSPVAGDFNKVFFVTAQTVFAVGGNRWNDSSRVILKSTDGGGSWSVSHHQPGKWLKAVYFTSLQNGIAAGDSGTILKTVNGGGSWVPVTSPVQRNLNSVVFVSPSTGFIVGGKENNDSIRTILKSVDGGDTWTIVKDEPGSWLKDATFIDQTTGYAVGDKACLLKTINGGQNWSQQTLSGVTGNETFNTVAFHDPNFGVVGGKSGKVFVYTDAAQPEASVIGADYVDSTRYLARVSINTHGTPVECRFDFSTDSSFTPNYVSYNQYITSDTFANVSIYLNGLIPNTTYYCRFVVKTILGTQRIDTLSFYTHTPRYTVETDSATNINLNWAQLNGKVDKVFFTAHPYFQYGLSPDLIQSATINCIPAYITDTLLHTVSANLQYLLPDTTYYFTLILQNPYGFVTGDTLSFKTKATPYTFQTWQASSITDSSATLNGIVGKLPIATNLYFDYGLTPLFGNTLVASPNLINDTLAHAVSASLSSLLADTTYYFRLRGTAGAVAYYGSPFSFFTANSATVVQTVPASSIFEASAQLNGFIDKLPAPANIYFEWGTTQALGATTPAFPPTINDTLPHNVTATAFLLQPGSRYYFRIKANTGFETFYGNTLTFYARNPYTVFTTGSATGITVSSAQLNGNVSGIVNATNLSFEYGTSPSLGSQISATPAVVSDSLPHSVSANLSGLNNNAIYYYRLKGVTAGYNNFYGNIRQLYAGMSEIPNWDFQYWQQDTFNIPNYWKTLTDNVERVPGNTGNYGIKISQLNALLLGNFVESQDDFPAFHGGQPLHFRPDSIQAYLNYNITTGDTGYLFTQMYSGANIISYKLHPIAGNSGGTYKKLSFPITYNSGAVPDSVVIGFISSNILKGSSGDFANNFIAVDDVSFYPDNTPVANGSFESWFPFVINRPLAWGYSMLYYTAPAASPYDPQVTQVLFNAPADYALELKNNVVDGILTGADLVCNGTAVSDQTPTFPVTVKHQTFNGYYQFYPVNNDTLYINLTLYKNGQNMGWAYLMETDSVTFFKPFDVPIYYYGPDSSAVPDSAGIQISTRSRMALGPSRLQIDKLSFDGFTSVEDNVMVNGNAIKVYPNPSQNLLIIESGAAFAETDLIQLIDLTGKTVVESKPGTGNKTEMDMASVNNGFYIVRIWSGKGCYSKKIAVIK